MGMVNFESFQTMGMAQQEYRNNRVNSFSAFVVEVENYLRVGTPFDRLTAEHVAIKLLQVPRVRERIKDEWGVVLFLGAYGDHGPHHQRVRIAFTHFRKDL